MNFVVLHGTVGLSFVRADSFSFFLYIWCDACYIRLYISAVLVASFAYQPVVIQCVPLVGHLPSACNLEVPTCVYQAKEFYTDYIGYTTTLTKNQRIEDPGKRSCR
jgi:hypothetical protein